MPLVGACPSQVPLYMLVGMRPKCTSPNNLLGECQKWAGIRLGENTPPQGTPVGPLNAGDQQMSQPFSGPRLQPCGLTV